MFEFGFMLIAITFMVVNAVATFVQLKMLNEMLPLFKKSMKVMDKMMDVSDKFMDKAIKSFEDEEDEEA